MLENINFGDSLKISNINLTQNNLIPVYIFCEFSLSNQENIDFKKFINNQLSKEEKNSIQSIKFNFTSDDLITLRNNKKEFYIVDKKYLLQLGFNENNINPSNIFYFSDNSSQKYLLFTNEGKIISISQEKSILNMNYNDIRAFILTGLILLYANEKELNKILPLNIADEYDFKNYYIVNKNWINKFKSLFNYDEVYKIISKINKYNSYKGYEKNIQSFFSKNELTNIIMNIKNNPDELIKQLSQIQFFPEVDKQSIRLEINCPIDFELISKSLFNIFKIFDVNKEINMSKLKHKMIIGNSNLYLQSNSNSNIFYIYCYKKNNEFNLFAINNFIKNKYFYKIFYQFLLNDDFISYIIKKNYDTNKINCAQDLFDSNNKKVGILILKYKLDENYIKNEKNKIKRKVYYSIYKNYKNFFEKFLSIKEQNLDLSSINNIDMYLSQNKLIYLISYLVEESQMRNIIKNLNFGTFEMINNLKDEKQKEDLLSQINIDDKINNLNIEIISEDKLQPNIKYSLVDKTFCKNINLPKEKYKNFKVILFSNQNNKFLYFGNSKLLLKIESFKNYFFNISKYDNSYNIKILLDNLIKLYNQEKANNFLLKSNNILTQKIVI